MSAVATTEDKPAAARNWVRTPEQQKLVDDHITMVREQYADADPLYLELLLDETIMGTPEIVAYLGYTGGTRAFQLYTLARTLAEAGQTPHPSAIPETDATAGKRGPRIIRGAMRGRVVEWAVQSGRKRWDSILRDVVPQEDLSHGGAPQSRKG